METKIFSFDHVFDEKIKQEDIFNNICTPLLDAFFQGYNCTIFAYGQTGSGKTHTMLGQPSSLFSNNETSSHGLIPRILNSIFSKIDNINLNNMGSSCGSVGRAVASDTSEPQFEFSHRQIFNIPCVEKKSYVLTILKSGDLNKPCCKNH